MSYPENFRGIEIAPLLEAVKASGKAILDIYATDFDVEIKGDDSPLTAADKAANEVLMSYVASYTPEIPVISEENKEVAYKERKPWSTFWLIDPLDGTKEFIKKNGEFTVNIALIENGAPILGVVYQPTTNTFYLGISEEGTWKIDTEANVTRLEKNPHYLSLDSVKVVASRSHLSDEVLAFVEELKSQGKEVDFLSAGSSLKFCLVAEGKADVYPRLGPTMEWDTGAAHAVALGAGRNVYIAGENTPLSYNKEKLLNPFFIVA